MPVKIPTKVPVKKFFIVIKEEELVDFLYSNSGSTPMIPLDSIAK